MTEDELSNLDAVYLTGYQKGRKNTQTVVYGCRELERQITLGASLGWEKKKWHLFNQQGYPVTEGADSIFKLIQQLEKL
tara:strand:- start:341 stop:577 length:237 start_codon:yes stop_codon:yes gene_type:complete